jgi:hypothetical protein
MDVPHVDTPEALVFGYLLTAQGMGSGGGREVMEAKMGIECQQAVRDLGV